MPRFTASSSAAFALLRPLNAFSSSSSITVRPCTKFPKRRPYNFSNDQQNVTLYPNSTNQFYVSWLYAFLTTPQGQFSMDSSTRPNAAIWVLNSPAADGDRDHGNNRQWTDIRQHVPF